MVNFCHLVRMNKWREHCVWVAGWPAGVGGPGEWVAHVTCGRFLIQNVCQYDLNGVNEVYHCKFPTANIDCQKKLNIPL